MTNTKFEWHRPDLGSARALARLWSVPAVILLLGLMHLTHGRLVPTFVYGVVQVQVNQTGSPMALNVVSPGTQTQNRCLALVDELIDTLRSNCPTCSIRSSDCSTQPRDSVRLTLGTYPLPYPSVRMPSGAVMEFRSTDRALAEQSCRETQRQSSNGLLCSVAGEPRPLNTARSEPWEQLNVLQWVSAGLTLTLACVLALLLIVAKLRKPRHLVRAQRCIHALADALLLMVAYLILGIPAQDNVAALIRYDARQVLFHIGLVLFNLACFQLYFEQYTRRRPWWDELREILRVLMASLLMAGAALFYTGLDAGRDLILWTWGSLMVLLPLGRVAVRQLMEWAGVWRRAAYIVGVGSNARDAYRAIQAEVHMGYDLIGFISPMGAPDDHPKSLQIGQQTLPVIPLPQDLLAWRKASQHCELIVALEGLSDPAAQKLVQQLMLVSNNVHVIPTVRGLPLFGARLSHFFRHEVLFLTVRNNLSRKGYLAIKRTFDLLVASVLIVLLSPLMLWVAWNIWREDGGPVIINQPRLAHGSAGTFRFYKFRSMVKNADDVLASWRESNSPEWQAYVAHNNKLPDDPRVLKIGRLIRRLSMDELPQLFNVLIGDMSLVGPRPLLPREIEGYGERLTMYQQARPGITGLWQVSGRSQTTFADRVALDQWYVQNWSIWYDLMIMVKTVKVVLGKDGAY